MLEDNKKFFVLDTNVLLYAPNALEAFEDNVLVICDAVIDELDKHKTSPGEVGFNAREVARKLDKFRLDTENGNLIDGYKLKSGGLLKIELNHENVKIPNNWGDSVDTRLLKLALGLKEERPNNQVILVSNDLFVRIKASVLGIETEEFLNQSVPRSQKEYKGRETIFVNTDVIDKIYKNGYIDKPFDNYEFIDKEDKVFSKENVFENEYFLVKAYDSQSSILTVFEDNKLKKLRNIKASGIEAITSGQAMVLDALCDSVKKTPLAAIKGPAGTGKTLLAIAAGLEAVDKGDFRRVLYLRANTVLDDEIGFLPGTEEEKLEWIIRPVKDNLEVLILKQHPTMKYSDVLKQIDDMFIKGKIKVESVGFMRGRSLNNLFIIIDEAQNLTPQQVKTLLSRAGKNTKVVLMGDIEQIDKPYLDYNNNGLSYACDRLKGSNLIKQITMMDSESERSMLSYEIIKRMK